VFSLFKDGTQRSCKVTIKCIDMRRIVIAVSGKPGSGKTTYAKFIAQRYGLRYISNGMIFRRLATERGYSFEEFHRIAESDPSIDKLIDERAIEEAKKGCVVVDGHLSVWVLKDIAHLKIICDASFDVRAERVSKRDNLPIQDVKMLLRLREQSNSERAKKHYGIDLSDLSVADLVVSTEKLDVEGVKKVIKTFIDEYKRLNPLLFP